jgi:iron complex transport system substrate-binding protein
MPDRVIVAAAIRGQLITRLPGAAGSPSERRLVDIDHPPLAHLAPQRRGRAAAAFDRRVAALRARYAGRPPVPVFFQISERPLLTINHRHIIDDVLRLCGGANVFAGLGALTPMVSPEAVLAANPEAIVTSGGEAGNETGFALWSKLPSLLATQRGNFVMLQRHHQPAIGPDTDGGAALCEQGEARGACRDPRRGG